MLDSQVKIQCRSVHCARAMPRLSCSFDCLSWCLWRCDI